jgi:hypothetical protein
MSEQKRTRGEAFAVSWEALNLAQDLSAEAFFCNPEHLKRRFRWFANKMLLAEMVERQRRIEGYCRQAYELQDLISDWADEYPLIKGENE